MYKKDTFKVSNHACPELNRAWLELASIQLDTRIVGTFDSLQFYSDGDKLQLSDQMAVWQNEC